MCIQKLFFLFLNQCLFDFMNTAWESCGNHLHEFMLKNFVYLNLCLDQQFCFDLIMWNNHGLVAQKSKVKTKLEAFFLLTEHRQREGMQ